MPIIDLPLEQLREYRPPQNSAADFDSFWSRTLAEAQTIPLRAEMTPIDYPVDDLDIYKVLYDGWRGATIAGYYLVRTGAQRAPALVVYHGYGGNKGQIYDYLTWALQGYAVFAVDVRGQSGESSDPGPYSSGHFKGWMTQGITSPEEYFYRGAYIDCVRALDFVVSRPEVDPDRIGVTGVSQGGGLTLAVAALDARPVLAMAEVPFLCHYRRALELTDRDPYNEIAQYCHLHPENADQVFSTLSYFDNLNLSDRIRCPILVTAGLQDLVCPPSTVFAVYNRISAPKEIFTFPYGAHATFPTHRATTLDWARRHLKG